MGGFVPVHGVDQAIDPILAWTEGIATHLACVARPTGASPEFVNSARYLDGTFAAQTVNLETGAYALYDGSSGTVNDNGHQYEVAVGGAVWDLYDAADDNRDGQSCGDSAHDGIDGIWSVVRFHTELVSDVCVFRDEYWKSQVNGSGAAATSALNATMCEHGVECWGAVAVEEVEQSSLAGVHVGVCEPNPTRGEIRLKVRAGTDNAAIDVGVYDLRGARVATVAQGRIAQGTTVLNWDGCREGSRERVEAGMYWIRASSGSMVSTRKLVVVR
jgi:hypothetical protein